MASSMFETSITEVTGPKISSCATRMFGFTSTRTVGSWKKPFPSAPSVGMRPPVAAPGGAAPAGGDRRAFLLGDRHIARDLLLSRLRDDRAEVRARFEAVAHLHLLRATNELGDEVVRGAGGGGGR